VFGGRLFSFKVMFADLGVLDTDVDVVILSRELLLNLPGFVLALLNPSFA
jgi:hypothetical protein